MSLHHVDAGFENWLATALGQYWLAREQAYFDQAITDVFGYNALQLGRPDCDFMRASRIPFRLRVGTDSAVDVRADFRDLPVASHSIDLVVMPHVLEFNDHPHQILREVTRVLMPEGHVVITGFNPWSLWGLRRRLHRQADFPWGGRFINLPRIKDWCALLGLEIIAGQMSCYVPPVMQQKWLDRYRFMEAAGDRWWPIAGGVYCLQAVKRVHGMRLIMPRWSDRLVPAKALASASRKVAGEREPLAARVGWKTITGGAERVPSPDRHKVRDHLRLIQTQ